MVKRGFILALMTSIFFLYASAEFEEDIVATSKGDLKMTFIGHGTLMFTFNSKVIHIDPVGRYADYANLPPADLILVTHEHGDHMDINVITTLSKPITDIICTEKCSDKIPAGIVMQNGDIKEIDDIKIEAVPAYNILHMRSPGSPFHPQGEGNGYILTLGDKRIYVAGDTENTPEMKVMTDIDIAFLPMNLPYTMTPEMVADAAKAFKPKILYPYHYGNTDTQKLIGLLKNEEGIEVRIRNLK